MELNLQPSHPASFDITLPCDIELLLLLCCSGHKILSTLPASLAEHRPASSDAFSYRVFVLGMSLFLNRLRGHLFGWQQSPQSWQKIIEVSGGMSSIACLCSIWVPLGQSVACSLHSPAVILHDPNSWSVVPVPVCSSAYLSPAALWLSSTSLWSLHGIGKCMHPSGQEYRSFLNCRGPC